MTNLVLQRYKTIVTHFASDQGPSNVSGVAHDLKENIEQAEAELAMSCPELHALNDLLRKALDITPWGKQRTDPVVIAIIGKMDDMAFKTGDMHPVASHPLPALMIGYMAMLVSYFSNESFRLTRWGEAKEKAENYIAALEEAEHA